MRSHYNRDRSRGCHGGSSPYGIMGDDDIDTGPHEFFGELLSTVASPLGIAELDLDVLAFRVAKGVQTAPESISERMRGRCRHQHANEGQFARLLSQRPERPRRRRAAEQGDELASSHRVPQPEGHTYHTVHGSCVCASQQILAADDRFGSKTGESRSEQMFSGLPPKAELRSAC